MHKKVLRVAGLALVYLDVFLEVIYIRCTGCTIVFKFQDLLLVLECQKLEFLSLLVFAQYHSNQRISNISVVISNLIVNILNNSKSNCTWVTPEIKMYSIKYFIVLIKEKMMGRYYFGRCKPGNFYKTIFFLQNFFIYLPIFETLIPK